MTVRRATVVLAAVLFAAGACSSSPRTTWVWPSDPQSQAGPGAAQPSASGSVAPSAAAAGALTGPVIINQSRSGPSERRLAVDVDGSWVCDNCAGDGKNTSGRLDATRIKQLRTFLDDPAFGEEDGVTPSTPSCSNRLESSMITNAGTVLWSTCRGGGPAPVASKILRLLSDATPLNPGLPA